MNFFGKVKLNGWQRIWLICSAILFIPIVFFDSGDGVFVIDNDPLTKGQISIVKKIYREYDDPTCAAFAERVNSKKLIDKDRVWISALVASTPDTRGNDVFKVLSDVRQDGNPCPGMTIAAVVKNGMGSKVAFGRVVDAYQKNQFSQVVSDLALWVVASLLLYGLGLALGVIAKWIKRGGFGSPSA